MTRGGTWNHRARGTHHVDRRYLEHWSNKNRRRTDNRSEDLPTSKLDNSGIKKDDWGNNSDMWRKKTVHAARLSDLRHRIRVDSTLPSISPIPSSFRPPLSSVCSHFPRQVNLNLDTNDNGAHHPSRNGITFSGATVLLRHHRRCR